MHVPPLYDRCTAVMLSLHVCAATVTWSDDESDEEDQPSVADFFRSGRAHTAHTHWAYTLHIHTLHVHTTHTHRRADTAHTHWACTTQTTTP
jgi:hypothetical protein